MKNATNAFESFFEIIKRLRSENGCPWDKVQTPLTMREPLIEETFEAVDAIATNDAEHTKEELGDVLLNAIMIAYMYEQAGYFSVADCFQETAEKLVRRHPHVFKESSGKSCVTKKVENANDVINQWDKIKDDIENRKMESILDEVPKGFPPLLRAQKLQKKAAKLGFDWNCANDVKDKIFEEIAEVDEAINAKNNNTIEEEIGDLLFAVVNYARKLNVNANVALARANEKFYRRFSFVEKSMKNENIPMTKDSLETQEKFWQKAKSEEIPHQVSE